MASQSLQQSFADAVARHQAGQVAEAAAIYRDVLRVDPDNVQALNLLGMASHQLGDTASAVALLMHAATLSPGNVAVHTNLSAVYCATGQYEQAITAARHALTLLPHHPQACSNLATALQRTGHHAEAEASLRHALAVRPELAGLWANLGSVLIDERRFQEALDAYRQAIAVDPRIATAHAGIARSLMRLGRHDEARAAASEGLTIDANDVLCRYFLGLLDLLDGEFTPGWSGFEWRLHLAGAGAPATHGKPLWSGEPLAAKTLLLQHEQGFGDSIQFARFAKSLADAGARVILEAPPELATLFQSVRGVAQVVTTGEPMPAFDLRCPIMSVPLRLGTTLASIPAEVPYLRAPVDRVATWKARLAAEPTAPRVGLCWTGSPRHPDDLDRSARLSDFAPLAAVDGVTFHSLQKLHADAPPTGEPFPIIDHTADLHDFADTAALIENLDLVITVDTAVAHLAGALAKPTWTMLAHLPEWRWMREREDSPWYRTMRLFRQPTPGDWPSVITAVASRLARVKKKK